MKNEIILLLCILILTSGVYAIPQTFNVQGKLTDSAGSILSGSYNMTFRIYNTYSSGTALWSETKPIIADSNGIYNVILNAINLGFSNQYYLGVEVGTDGEMTPRINLTSSPYTFRANITDYLDSTKNYYAGNLNATTDICIANGVCLSTVSASAGGWTHSGTQVALTTSTDNVSIGSTPTLFVDNTNGYVGIGTTTPSQKLDVNGNINIADGKYYMYAGQNAFKLAIGSDEGIYSSTLIGINAGGLTPYAQTAIGYNAGNSNTGSYQTAIGGYAGQSNTGTSQTAIGYNAGRSNTGSYQTAIGYNAGNSNTGSYQTALGYYTGFLNSGDRVTSLGYQAARSNSGNDTIAIGYNAGLSNTVSNQFILKQANINSIPLIQGNFLTGNVGIGTTNPSQKFEINGTSGAFNINPDNSGGPLLNTTSGNVTITSSGGSVIIKLG